jgi:hypothetical protein
MGRERLAPHAANAWRSIPREMTSGHKRAISPGGGYIVTSGNSLAGYLVPENVLALSRAVQKYGQYPL